ncbi:hypothetical protein CAJAP_07769 [Camponotus japonicus]
MQRRRIELVVNFMERLMRKQCYYSPLQVTHRIYTCVMAKRRCEDSASKSSGVQPIARRASKSTKNAAPSCVLRKLL